MKERFSRVRPPPCSAEEDEKNTRRSATARKSRNKRKEKKEKGKSEERERKKRGYRLGYPPGDLVGGDKVLLWRVCGRVLTFSASGRVEEQGNCQSGGSIPIDPELGFNLGFLPARGWKCASEPEAIFRFLLTLPVRVFGPFYQCLLPKSRGETPPVLFAGNNFALLQIRM